MTNQTFKKRAKEELAKCEPVESVSKEKHPTGITARIDKDTLDKGLWLVIENNEDDDQNVSWPLQESEVAAVKDACEEYLRINQKE